MSKIIVLVGNIGSGKTTWIKKFLKKTKGKYVVVSRDAIRYMIGGGKYIFDLDLEPAVWNSEGKIIEEFMKLKVNIIVDEVGINKKLRKKYIDLANQFGYEKIAMEMPKLSKQVCVDRRMQNPHQQADRKLWESVWDNFDKMYEAPIVNEGFHKVEHKGEK
ncbi:hypothetical protein LCGC14_1685060 [marine sediment metagenome]|uniref:Zeta toxin domain-containing protein n=1 Tax=marine sediment metagenome TaxID=412755 RepID=A0A0F9IA11_9ZZZZ